MKLPSHKFAVIFVLVLTLQLAVAFKWPTLDDLFQKKDDDDKVDLWGKWPKLDLFKPINLFDIFNKKEAKKSKVEEDSVEEEEPERKDGKLLDLFDEKKLKKLLDKLIEKKDAKSEEKASKEESAEEYASAEVYAKKPKKCGVAGRKHEIIVKCPDMHVYGNDDRYDGYGKRYDDDSNDASYETVYGKKPYYKQSYQPKRIYEDIDFDHNEENIKYFT